MTAQQQAYARLRDRMSALMQDDRAPAPQGDPQPITDMIGRIGQALDRYHSA